MKGDIVFVRFPYTDLSIAKPRPALVLHEERDEVVLAYISSRVPIIPSGTDVLVLRKEPYFEATGLNLNSALFNNQIGFDRNSNPHLLEYRSLFF